MSEINEDERAKAQLRRETAEISIKPTRNVREQTKLKLNASEDNIHVAASLEPCR